MTVIIILNRCLMTDGVIDGGVKFVYYIRFIILK